MSMSGRPRSAATVVFYCHCAVKLPPTEVTNPSSCKDEPHPPPTKKRTVNIYDNDVKYVHVS
jgi:hypothetical protein